MPRTAHCVGIGGVGLSGLAKCLLAQGWRVSGCDRNRGPTADLLEKAGARILVGHDPAHMAAERPDVLVRSAAISDDHPEVVAARKAGVEVVKYAEMLGRLMAEREGVVCKIGVAPGETVEGGDLLLEIE